MTIFQSDEQLYAVLHAVFDQLVSQPEKVSVFAHSNLVVRIRLHAPDAEILLDGRQPPMEVFYGPRPGRADIEIALAADLLHAIWLGREDLARAIFSRQVQMQGKLPRANHVTALMQECAHLYPPIAARFDLSIEP